MNDRITFAFDSPPRIGFDLLALARNHTVP